jgi:acetyl-CoA carboxylase alpha subunit
MANETSRSIIADKLANVIAPGANGDALANAIRSGSKIVVLTQAAYDALSPKDANTIYITTP